MNLKKNSVYKLVGEKIVRLAGKYLLDKFNKKHKIFHKGDFHYSISEDLELNEIYSNYFRKHTPEASLFTEEGEKDLENDFVWVVDPIEGTSNYSVGIPFYATQVCLLYKRDPVISYVFAPSLNQFFYAIKNHGTFLNSKRINVSNLTEINKSLASANKGTKSNDLLWYGGTVKEVMKHVRTFRSFGACGLELAYIAAGKMDIFMVSGAHSIYDYSPGALLVKEAGGVVVDFNGHEWDINASTLLATNSHLAPKMLEILKIK